MTVPQAALTDLPDPLDIEPVDGPLDATVRVPGSKSVTNRALVCAALADGTSMLEGALFADDTEAMLGVLEALGVETAVHSEAATMEVVGCAGSPPSSSRVVDVRQSGTTARFALPLLALGQGSYRVTAHPQMQARPMGETLEVLGALGCGVEALGGEGRLPATITAGMKPGVVRVRGDVSSQFLSGLLLAAPCVGGEMVIEVTGDLVSRPYVDLTLAVMASFGAQVEEIEPQTFVVLPTGYRATRYTVEPDASAASYPLAAAAICGGRVKVTGLTDRALQGDVAFADVLAAMGAEVIRDDGGTEVRRSGGELSGGRFDLTHFSDTAQTLAVVAPFATSSVTVTGIGFIRRKEIDRIAAVARELGRCGVAVTIDDDGWTINPGRPLPTTFETYEDHRMAMSFALVGLAVPGIRIAGPNCVAKTFPGYWKMLDSLRSGG